jgi:hypothetical protein
MCLKRSTVWLLCFSPDFPLLLFLLIRLAIYREMNFFFYLNHAVLRFLFLYTLVIIYFNVSFFQPRLFGVLDNDCFLELFIRKKNLNSNRIAVPD